MALMKKMVRKVFSRNTLYYPGCVIKSVAPEIGANWEQILKKIGVEFIKIDEFVCCGSPVLAAGYKDDFEELRSIPD